MVLEEKKSKATTDIIRFLKDHVLSITDITWTSKLTEILESYANMKSTQVFIVQNTRNKDAQTILADFEFFEELLSCKEAVDEAMDEIMYQIALERKDEACDIPLSQVLSDLNMDEQDLDDIKKLIDEVE